LDQAAARAAAFFRFLGLKELKSTAPSDLQVEVCPWFSRRIREIIAPIKDQLDKPGRREYAQTPRGGTAHRNNALSDDPTGSLLLVPNLRQPFLHRARLSVYSRPRRLKQQLVP
jgi:hypothetical protein